MNFLKENSAKIFTIIFIIITVYIIYITINEPEEKLEEADEVEIKETKKEEKKDEKVIVDVKGEVTTPGVYELTSKNTVIDAINKAGGLTKNSDTSNINLSKKLMSEMVIIVYSKLQIKKMNTQNEITCPPCNNACIQKADEKSKLNINETNKINGQVNINSASLEQLQTLTGIGPSKASAIIEYRQKTTFKTIEDIKNVPGIGQSAFEKIKDQITV